MILTRDYKPVVAAFNTPSEFELEGRGEGLYVTFFTVWPFKYRVVIVETGLRPDVWKVSFSLSDVVGTPDKLRDYFQDIYQKEISLEELPAVIQRIKSRPMANLNLRQEKPIFSTIFQILKQFIQKESPRCLEVSAPNAKKFGVYQTLARRYLPGWEILNKGDMDMLICQKEELPTVVSGRKPVFSAFNTPSEYQEDRGNTENSRDYYFDVGLFAYKVHFGKVSFPGYKNIWSLSFSLAGFRGRLYDLQDYLQKVYQRDVPLAEADKVYMEIRNNRMGDLDLKQEKEVFSTLFAIVKEFVVLEQPNCIYFSGTSPKKFRVYETMVRRFMPDWVVKLNEGRSMVICQEGIK